MADDDVRSRKNVECASSPSIIAIKNTLLMFSGKKNVPEEVRTISVVKTCMLCLPVAFNNINIVNNLPKGKILSINLITFKGHKILGIYM